MTDPDDITAEPAPTRRRRRWADDAGLTGVAATFMLLVALAGGGLVYDGGRALGAKRDAINDAEGAARAAVSVIGFDGLNADAARAAARAHLAAAGVAPEDIVSIDVDGVTVTVTVTVIARRPSAFAALLGNDTLVMSGTGDATGSFGGTP